MTPDFPITTLSNGLRIGNFSSPHDFTFTDGSVLAACSPEIAKTCSLDSVEQEKEVERNGVPLTFIALRFQMSGAVEERLHRWLCEKVLGRVDVVLVPLPVLQALPDAWKESNLFVSVRMADRVSKTAHVDRFCT